MLMTTSQKNVNCIMYPQESLWTYIILLYFYCAALLTGAPEQSLRLAMLLDLGGSGQNTMSFGGGIGSGSHIVVSRDEQISRMRERICYNGKLKETDGFASMTL